MVPSIRVLSLSCAYPNPAEPELGLFVQRRLQYLARFVELKVVAPVAALDYASPSGQKRFIDRHCPASRQDGVVPVIHPRWAYPPFGGALNSLFLFISLIRPIARMRREFPFDVIDAHFGYPTGIAGALLSATLESPFTITLRGNETMHGRDPFCRWLLGWAIRRAARVFAVSERLRQFAIALGADPAKVVNVPNGIDGSIFFPRDRLECRRKHGLPLDAKIILSAGYLIERKGHHHVIAALSSLLRQGITARLVIAGGPGREGRFENKIRALVQDLGLGQVISLAGQVAPDAMAELMSAADVLCLASSREGSPNVVLESLGCGTPVVATDVGGIPEIIASDNYGFVVPTNNVDALRDALHRALQKEWDRAAIACCGRSRSWDQVANDVYKQMRELVEETGKVLIK